MVLTLLGHSPFAKLRKATGPICTLWEPVHIYQARTHGLRAYPLHAPLHMPLCPPCAFHAVFRSTHRPRWSPSPPVTCISTQEHLLSTHSPATIKTSFFQQTLTEPWFGARPWGPGVCRDNSVWSYLCLAPRPVWDTAW